MGVSYGVSTYKSLCKSTAKDCYLVIKVAGFSSLFSFVLFFGTSTGNDYYLARFIKFLRGRFI